MAIAPTADYDELILEVEFTPSSGTFTRVCGLTDFTINRANNVDTTEVPDCADESLPHYNKRSVRSQDTNISGTGVWAITNHADMMSWFRAGSTLNVKVTNAYVTANGSVGDPEEEVIPMILQSLNNSRTKGQVVSGEIEMVQNGDVTVTTITV